MGDCSGKDEGFLPPVQYDDLVELSSVVCRVKSPAVFSAEEHGSIEWILNEILALVSPIPVERSRPTWQMELSRNDTQLLSKEIVYLIPEAVVVCEAAVTVPVLRYALCCTAVLYGDVM